MIVRDPLLHEKMTLLAKAVLAREMGAHGDVEARSSELQSRLDLEHAVPRRIVHLDEEGRFRHVVFVHHTVLPHLWELS